MKIIDVKQFSETEKIYTILVTPQEEVPYGKALPKDMATGSKMRVVGSDIEWTYSKSYGEDFIYEEWTSPLSPIAIGNDNTELPVVPPNGDAEVIGESLAEAIVTMGGSNYSIIIGSGKYNTPEDPFVRFYGISDAYYENSTYSPELEVGSICEFRFSVRVVSGHTTSGGILLYLPPRSISELIEVGSFYVKTYLTGEISEIGNGVLIPFVLTMEVKIPSEENH